MTKLTFGFLGLIVFIAVFFRMYQLGNVPYGFHQDEATFAYNAYSLLLTGKDIAGNFLPLHLESFWFSPLGYSYITIPFIYLFGLNAFSARIVSALAGIFTVVVTFFLVRKLLKKEKGKEIIALFASFFLAISPWHINLSRTVTENIIVVLFVALGVYLYIHWLENQEKKLFLIFSFLSFSLTLLVYQAPRAFLPLFIPFLVLFFYNKGFSIKKIIAVVCLYVLLIILPVMIVLSSSKLATRMQSLSIFQHPLTGMLINESLTEDGKMQAPLFTSRLFHNKIIGYTATFSKNYFDHFSYNFLFTDNGLPERYRVPSMGLLYSYQLPLIIFSLFTIIRKREKIGYFFIIWILIAPVGSALTFDAIPNLQRTILVEPGFAFLSAYGLYNFFQLLRFQKKIFFVPGAVFALVVILFSVGFYLQQYFVNQTAHRPWYRNEGNRELITELETKWPQYQKIISSDDNKSLPIIVLFFLQYDPSRFQYEIHHQGKVDFEHLDHISFGKYTFIPDDCVLPAKQNTLYITSAECKNLKNSIQILSTIFRKDGSGVFGISLKQEK